MTARIMVITLALLAAVLLLGWAAWSDGRDTGRYETLKEWDQQRLADAQANAAAAHRARQVEAGLQARYERMRKAHAEELDKLHRRHAATVDSLRHRPERPADYVPATAPAAQLEPAAACSADRLFRNDGEFLAGLARSADEAVASLHECRAAYESVQGVN